MAVLYFGSLGDGHLLHSVGERHMWHMPKGFPWTLGNLDAGLLQNGRHSDNYNGRVWWVLGGQEQWWLGFIWWDRSGDSRSNSNSGLYMTITQPKECFYLEYLGREKVIREEFKLACAAFPSVVSRQRFPLVLQV